MIDQQKSADYMKRFSANQKGEVGDMSAGEPPADYCEYPYYTQLYVMWSNGGNVPALGYQSRYIST